MTEPFDKKALMERVDDDVEFLEETVEMLEEDAPDMLRQIRVAVEAADADTLAKSAHAMKGMLANFCAATAESTAKALEFMGREERLDGAPETLQELEQETERLVTALRSFLQEASA